MGDISRWPLRPLVMSRSLFLRAFIDSFKPDYKLKLTLREVQVPCRLMLCEPYDLFKLVLTTSGVKIECVTLLSSLCGPTGSDPWPAGASRQM